jgi:hypothetical protein
MGTTAYLGDFVVGGIGYFLQKADMCLLMENYRCHDITAKVRKKLEAIATETAFHADFSTARRLAADNFNPAYENQRLKKIMDKCIKNLRNAPKQLEYGMDVINLDAVSQIAEAPQILSIGYCIDSIAQSWSVISGKSEKNRARQAMESVEKRLIKTDEKLALLLAPPFDKTALEPSYIKGYPPGIRENGGQYTHAAAWTIIAFALLGDGDKAHEIFALINPINHTWTSQDIAKYKTEPYSIAADVYSNPQHIGCGGWTWYTGSAGWLYRAALEYILGFKKQGTSLSIEPCIPRNWKEFEVVVTKKRHIR